MSLFTIDELFCFNIVQTLAHSVWIGLIIGLVTMIANRSLHTQKPNSRYWVNLLALFAFAATLPITYLLISDETEIATEVSVVEDAAMAQPQPVLQSDSILAASNSPIAAPATVSDLLPLQDKAQISQSWFSAFKLPIWLARIIATAYLLGVCYMCFRLAMAIRRSQKLLRESQLVTEPNLLKKVKQVSRTLSLKFQPIIATSENIAVPIAVGILRPTVLLPTSIMAGLSVSEIELVLRHELAHLRRYDHFVIVFQRLIESILFFHPVTWYLSGRIHEERENCCDDLACASGVNRIQYANVLLRVAELTCVDGSFADGNSSVALAADGHRPSKLRQRISRLLIASPSKPATGQRALLCIAILLSMSAAVVAGHVLTSGFGDGSTVTASEDDLAAELFDRLKAAADSYESVRTGHLRFKFTRNPVVVDINHEQCKYLLEEIGPIDNGEKLNELLRAFTEETNDRKPVSFTNAELHFDQERTRERISSRGGSGDIHITDAEYSLRWDSANYQMNVLPINDNRYFQMTKGLFLRPLLPKKDRGFYKATLEELRKSKITLNEQGYLLESGEDAVGPATKVLVSKESGYPLMFSKNLIGDIKYYGGWKQYPDGIWFPSVVFELRFRDGKLKYFDAHVIESAKFNIDLPDHLFVMSAPAGTTLVRGEGATRLQEDVFDVLAEDQVQAAQSRKKREFTEEEKRGAAAAKKLYSLKEGEIFKRIEPPYPLAQKYVAHMQGYNTDGRRPNRVISRIFTYKDDGSLDHRHSVDGGTYKVGQVAQHVFSMNQTAIEGPEDILNKPLPGDFVVRANADRLELEKAFRRMLESELQAGIEVKTEEVNRPTYIASGELKLDLDAGKEVAVHSGSKPNAYPATIDSGDVKKFLGSLSRYINTSVTHDSIGNAEQRFSWSTSLYGNEDKPKNKRFDFQAEKVLEIVSKQTGLKFEKSEAKKTVLSIRPLTN